MRALGCPPPGGRTLGEAEGEGSEVVGEDGESIGSIGPASACGVDHHHVVNIKMITMMIIIMLSKMITMIMMMLPDACSPPPGAFCSTRFATVKVYN